MAQVRCTDGHTLSGRVFIPVTSSHHTGAMRPEEWLNDTPEFLAFLPDGAAAAVLVNKRSILALTVSAAVETPDEREEELDLPRRQVVVELPDLRLEGILVVDMPIGHRRVLDHLNRVDLFLTLRTEDSWHLVNKRCILRVHEVGEE